MLKYFIIPMACVFAIFYGAFRYGGDYVFLSDSDHIDKHPEVTLFNVPVESGKIENGILEIESPFTGVRFVDFSANEERGIQAKQCGRLKVKLNPERRGWAYFEKSGCFLDW